MKNQSIFKELHFIYIYTVAVFKKGKIFSYPHVYYIILKDVEEYLVLHYVIFNKSNS